MGRPQALTGPGSAVDEEDEAVVYEVILVVVGPALFLEAAAGWWWLKGRSSLADLPPTHTRGRTGPKRPLSSQLDRA